MLGFYSRIVVPYDGSELSEKALQTAVNLALENKQTALHILHIMKPRSQYETHEKQYEGTYNKQTEQAMALLRDVEESLYDIMNPLKFLLREGLSGKEIVKYAEESDCDLIVMGSRGLSGLKEWFLGSVSYYVIQHSRCSILIVK